MQHRQHLPGQLPALAGEYAAYGDRHQSDQRPAQYPCHLLGGGDIDATMRCLLADTWNNVQVEYIDPNNPSKGIQVISADLIGTGTFYLEELDSNGNPVKHIPTDLTVSDPPAGGTTIAVLRLGLANPLSQYFLKPNTSYRATLVGGANGVCSAASSAPMTNTFQWTFSTEQTCVGIAAPVVGLMQPPDGSIDRPLNQAIVLDFSNRLDPTTLAFVPGNLAASSFGVYADPQISGGDLSSEGTVVTGQGVFSNLGRTLTYQPSGSLPTNAGIYVRLTNHLKDTCHNPLQTPATGSSYSASGRQNRIPRRRQRRRSIQYRR